MFRIQKERLIQLEGSFQVGGELLTGRRAYCLETLNEEQRPMGNNPQTIKSVPKMEQKPDRCIEN